MAVISLPLSFNNSFWTQDYRTGLEVLFHKLEQGVAENDEIIAFFRARAIAEGNLAASLRNPIPTTGAGFHADDGASLLTAFRGIQAESLEQAKAHEAVAKDLHTLVADPFQQWAQGHKDKLRQAKNVALEGWLRSYEYSREDVHKLKDQYLTKVRRADEAEDDARLVSSEISDKYTNSPRLSPRDQHKGPTRQPTVSERITQRLRDLGRSTTTATNTSDAGERQKSEQVFDAESEKSPSKMDKGKGRAADQEAVLASSPPPLSPPLPPTLSIVPPPDPEPVLLAGFPFAPTAIARFLTQAKGELPLRPVRFPILGEYQDCFSGEEFVTWLRENVQAFDRNLDLAAAAAKDLTEREDLLRRLGEFGNAFENANDSFYQFRPKAFTFGQPHVAKSPTEVAPSPIVKTSSNFVNIVSKALASGPSEPPFVRSRREAETADIDYRDSVRKLDRQRLGLEERIEDILKALQKWESERLRTIQTVLHQYQGSIASFRKGYDSSVERSATLVSSYNPDSDLKALIERYRTGPFRPTPHTYESVAHDELDVVFGIDLRKWAEGGWSTVTGEEEKKDQVPPMLLTLLNALKDRYEKIQDDAEKRKIWIYEVPLTAVHHLRESLNAVPAGQDIPEDLLNKYDPPVIAASVKLWMLELDPPLGMYDGWDDVRKLYPQVGAIKPEGEVSQQQHFEAVQSALQKLPKVHLSVIDVIIHHFKELIDKTKSDESNEVYLAKLALAIGRGIIRPKHENEISIHDRHPTLFFIDLVEHYDKLLPPTIEKKKRESERKVPTRRRTKIVDMRMRRSNLSDTSDLKEIIVAQHHAKSPPSSLKSPPASRASFSSSSAPTVAPAPERIKVQAPVAVLPKNHGLPSALRPAHVGTNGTPSPPAFLPPPPPPPLMAPPPPSAVVPPPPHIIAPPPPPPIKVQDPATPPRPTFKEPPPELDNLPPRPMFKEPPPEFEDEDEQRIRTPQMSPKIASPQPSSPSRSASPATSLSRATSAGRVRGPRTTRGPRAATGTNRRESFGPSPPSPSPSHPVTRGHVRTGSRGSNTPTNRRSGSASSFSRRTMASDAEDDVVNK